MFAHSVGMRIADGDTNLPNNNAKHFGLQALYDVVHYKMARDEAKHGTFSEPIYTYWYTHYYTERHRTK